MADPDHPAHDLAMKKKILDARRIENLAKARQKAAELRDQLIAMKLERGKRKPTKLELEIEAAKKDLQDDQKDEPQPTPEEPPEDPPSTSTSEPTSTADHEPVSDPDPTPVEQSDHPPEKPKRAPAKRAPRAKSAHREESRPNPTEAPPEVVEPIPRAPLYRREGGLLFI
jgi:hypothetical protein